MNACVGDNGGPYDLFDYGKGFFEGGHAIVEAASERAAPVDLLVYPAAFSYRHAIELLLKQLVLSLNLVLESHDGFNKHHKMIDLWSDVSALIRAMPKNVIEQQDADKMGEIVAHFDAFDPTGQVFRYPEDIKGNRHLAEHKLINVEVLRDQMKELQEVMERCYYQLCDHRERQLEQAAENGSG